MDEYTQIYMFQKVYRTNTLIEGLFLEYVVCKKKN